MKGTEIVNKLSRSAHKLAFQIKKHSPEILVAVGVVGTVASGVMACKATLKVHEIVEDAKTDIDEIHEAVENGVTKAGKEYSDEDSQKDLSIVYVQTGWKLVKLYAPSVVLGALSITAMVSSNNILRKRNMALAAAYTAVDKSFKEYRGRVVERFGKDLDRELRYNVKATEVDEIVVNEDGTESVVKSTVEVPNLSNYSDYAKFFDQTSSAWVKDAELNLAFLKGQEAWANQKLRNQGYLFLNEVYDSLGMNRTRAGQTVGWIYDDKNPVGDNCVDFGIYTNRLENRRFVNGLETSILLDFNVDGDILYKIDEAI